MSTTFKNNLKIKIKCLKKYKQLPNYHDCHNSTPYKSSIYSTELGFPQWFTKIHLMFSNNISEKKKNNWSKVLLNATPIGVNLNKIKPRIICMIVKNTLKFIDSIEYNKNKFIDVNDIIYRIKLIIPKILNEWKDQESEEIAISSLHDKELYFIKNLAEEACYSTKSFWSPESAISAKQAARQVINVIDTIHWAVKMTKSTNEQTIVQMIHNETVSIETRMDTHVLLMLNSSIFLL